MRQLWDFELRKVQKIRSALWYVVDCTLFSQGKTILSCGLCTMAVNGANQCHYPKSKANTTSALLGPIVRPANQKSLYYLLPPAMSTDPADILAQVHH
jgi:hypothetical protein